VLDEFLRDHDGVITLHQARAAGLSQDAVDRRVRSGHWRRCAPGVYFARDHAFTDDARIRSLVWGYGNDAVASGLTAAYWHRIVTDPPKVVEVTVGRQRHLRLRAGSRLRRRDLKPADIVERRGLRVTSLPLTVLEAAVRRPGGITIVDRALQQHTELPALWGAQLRNTGRHGSPRARILLQAADGNARSQGERLLIRLLTAAGIDGWTANHPVGPYLVDTAFIAQMVAIEVDGLAFHTDSEIFNSDRARQNYLVLHGWHVLRFTWRDLTTEPERVIAEIRGAICGR